MSLRHLHYFVAAAEELHFGKAAERVHVSQPALSRQIANLESELGVLLFERLARGVRLTDAGEVFLVGAQQIVLAYEQTRQNTLHASRGAARRLRIGLTDFSLVYPAVPESVASVRSDTSVHVELSFALSSTLQMQALLAEQIDGGYLYYFDDSRVSAVAYHPIAEETILLALPDDHPLAKMKEVPLDRLETETFVWVRHDTLPDLYDQLMLACRTGGVMPRIVQEAPTETTLLQLVALRMGLGLVRSSLAAKVPKGVQMRPVRGLKLRLRFGFAHLLANQAPMLKVYVKQLRAAAIAK